MVQVAPPEHRRLSTGAKLVLFVLLPVLILAVLVAGVVTAVPLLVGRPFSQDYRADAGAAVRIEVENARIDVAPGSTEEVTVEVTGSYSGSRPEFQVGTAGDETRIEGGCRGGILVRCDLRLLVAVPASSDIIVRGTNGQVSVGSVDGAVDVETRNGRLDVADTTGPLTLATTNGGIQLEAVESARVTARTTNGGIEMDFAGPPSVVDARSTNGGITIRVPDDGEDYFLDTDTTNGPIDDDEVPTDRTAERTITARTTNGGITVERR